MTAKVSLGTAAPSIFTERSYRSNHNERHPFSCPNANEEHHL